MAEVRPLGKAHGVLQQEGDVLARKNGELEASSRKLRAQLKEAVSDQERLNKRLAQQDELMAAENGRLEKRLTEALKQVFPLAGRKHVLFTSEKSPPRLLVHTPHYNDIVDHNLLHILHLTVTVTSGSGISAF